MCDAKAKLKAVYTVSELANLAGVSRFRVLRLLGTNRVPLKRSGRRVVVLLSDLQYGFPSLWDSLILREQLEHSLADSG